LADASPNTQIEWLEESGTVAELKKAGVYEHMRTMYADLIVAHRGRRLDRFVGA
jgi:hypothetical protein